LDSIAETSSIYSVTGYGLGNAVGVQIRTVEDIFQVNFGINARMFLAAFGTDLDQKFFGGCAHFV
jgi:hypothetical protein